MVKWAKTLGDGMWCEVKGRWNERDGEALFVLTSGRVCPYLSFLGPWDGAFTRKLRLLFEQLVPRAKKIDHCQILRFNAFSCHGDLPIVPLICTESPSEAPISLHSS